MSMRIEATTVAVKLVGTLVELQEPTLNGTLERTQREIANYLNNSMPVAFHCVPELNDGSGWTFAGGEQEPTLLFNGNGLYELNVDFHFYVKWYR